jgi:3-oxoadipate enol-lactonase
MSEMKFATIGEITLHYTLAGVNNGVPLVFINSLGSDLRIWDKVVSRLAPRFSIIRYDKRGHGLSDCPPGPYTISDHAADLAGLLEHLQITEVIPIGISVGGMIAQAFALERPQRVKALVLCDTGAKIGTTELWNERIDILRQKGMAYLGDAILARWFSSTFAEQHPADYRGYYNMLTRMPVEGYTATCEALRDADFREVVGQIQAKTLVLCGSEDLSTPPDLNRALAASLPDARFELIEQAAHLPCIEQPEAMATKIGQFLGMK